MTVGDYIRAITESEVSDEDILSWMVENKACPLDVRGELKEGGHIMLWALPGGDWYIDGYGLDRAASLHCEGSECGPECYKSFLGKDFEE